MDAEILEGYPDILEAFERYASEETGAYKGKKDISTKAKLLNLDCILDTVQYGGTSDCIQNGLLGFTCTSEGCAEFL